MTLFVVLGLFILGWALGGFLKLPTLSRQVLSGGLGYAVTAVTFQLFWLLGVPFYAISFVWWLVVGSLLGWFALGWWQERDEIQHRLFRAAQSTAQKIKSVKLDWQRWPIIIFAAVCGFSLLIIGFWSMTVRPVAWDNFALYDTRARLLGQNISFVELRERFSWDYDATSYDFIHPFGGSMVSALAYQVEGDFVAVTTLPLLFSVLGLPFLLWESWTSRWAFWLLLTSTRLLFEQAIEGYASWSSALLWFLGLGVLFLWKEKPAQKWLTLAGIFFAATLTLRASEPFWAILSMSWIAWQLVEKRTWKISLIWQVLPWLVLFEWSWIRRDVFTLVAQQFHPQVLNLMEGVLKPSFISSFIEVLWRQKDFWPFLILLVLFSQKVHFKKYFYFFLLLILWFLVLIGGAGYLIWTHPFTGPEFVLAWPRASLPITALLILLLACILERKTTKR